LYTKKQVVVYKVQKGSTQKETVKTIKRIKFASQQTSYKLNNG